MAAQLDQVGPALTKLSGSGTPAAKLRPFKGVKFGGRREDLERFKMEYDAQVHLDTGNWKNWSEQDKVHYLATALEGRAAEVLLSIKSTMPGADHTTIWNEFERNFIDVEGAIRAREKLQAIKQKKSLDDYILEFNQLRGIACRVDPLSDETLRQYFLRGLKDKQGAIIAAVKPALLAQAMDLAREIAKAQGDSGSGGGSSGSEPMDLGSGEKISKRCHFCHALGHLERDCRKKKASQAKKDNQEKRPQGCFVCGGKGHFARDCNKRARVFEGEEVNKSDSE